ncbi:expressed unknown protein [Ectocarpus siliculosus]|uniref:Uncharacterized protein n=1 Tax=Ectocarpus siliculosus TaxID=2880 RepID=D8LJV4_ECTSI|nr:expressed unknown protein [Ectocarpus siliculosus]|eukprot:CBN76005.1 expressed unknown protein [Ectocarpus siliculosus]
MLSSVLKGYKPTFTYSSIFTGFAVDRVPMQKADEIRLDNRVLKVVENRVVSALSKELLIETLQTKYTVVNRDTGELYDVREIDTSMPYRYSVLPHNMRVPSKARQLLGINEQPTHVPPKAAKVFGHNPYRQHVTPRDGNITDKAAQVLGVIPQSAGAGGRGGGGYRRPHVGRGPRGTVEEEDDADWGEPLDSMGDDDGMGMLHAHGRGVYMGSSQRPAEMTSDGPYDDEEEGDDLPVALWRQQRRGHGTLNQ